MQHVSRYVHHRELAGLVDKLWWTPADPAKSPSPERILPTARAQIIISGGPNGSVFVGPKTVSSDIVRHHDNSMVGVSLHAGTTLGFADAPTDELVDETVSLDFLWNIRYVAEELAGLGAEAAMARLETELVARLRSDLIDNRVLRAERAIRSGTPAGRLAAALGEDRRKLVPDFRRAVGVGPKHYERIRRFGRSIGEIRRSQPQRLATIAADLGYSDQAHLTREVKHFTTVAPTSILGDGTTTPNHLALPTRTSRRHTTMDATIDP